MFIDFVFPFFFLLTYLIVFEHSAGESPPPLSKHTHPNTLSLPPYLHTHTHSLFSPSLSLSTPHPPSLSLTHSLSNTHTRARARAHTHTHTRARAHTHNRLVGLVVKASASRAEDPGFESRLRRDFFGVESYQ